ncbi:AbrB/MazE/SpoVT family DNA-binding domain-containing protein [Paenibacillus enshidis]|uniref:AbrB/MazE/SpoVT family DNA-binding domain-containing protein n=1 Tax=Paenibacillus enshidis TaxID=1458439 RepID=A0ABV5AYP8_9BACL
MRNSIGIVRLVDDIGRIVVPSEFRQSIGIGRGDSVEFFVDEQSQRIMIRLYRAQECLFCQSMMKLFYYKGLFVCSDCLVELPVEDARQTVSHMVSREIAVTFEDYTEVEVAKEPRPRLKRSESIRLLIEVMAAFPTETQSMWAKRLGITQGRVSQLLYFMREGKQPRNRS